MAICYLNLSKKYAKKYEDKFLRMHYLVLKKLTTLYLGLEARWAALFVLRGGARDTLNSITTLKLTPKQTMSSTTVLITVYVTDIFLSHPVWFNKSD